MTRNALCWISAAVIALLLLGAQPASAHGYLIRAIPQDRASLERAPTRVQYWFSETLEAAFTAVTVRDQAGVVVSQGGVDDNDPRLLSARLPTDLPDGAYIAELRVAFASDGHVITETRVFFVGAAVAGVGGMGGSDQAVPLEVTWRALSYVTAILLFGAFVSYTLVLVPAWGNANYRAGLLPPRVMTRLNLIVIASLIGLVIAQVIALLQQSMIFFNADLARVLGEQLWTTVRAGTRFGDTWNVRMLLLLVIAGVWGAGMLFRKDQPEGVRASWVANAWAGALLLGTFSVASHASGSLILPWAALINDWLHLLAAGVWVGGVAALALTIPVGIAPYTGDARRQAVLAALRRFSPLAAAGLALVSATGVYAAINWFYTPADLATTYGGALIVKLALVAPLIGVGALHHAALNPTRFARLQALAGRIRSFIPTLRLEAVIALLALGAAALLASTPLPQPEISGRNIEPPAGTLTVGAYTISAQIAPGGPGINTYDVVITRDGAPVDDAAVLLQMSDPINDRRAAWQPLESIGDGVYTTAGDAISAPGTWWTAVDFAIDGERTRAAFAWSISADAAVQLTRPPSPLNLLALAGVIGASVFAVYPLLRRFYHALDLQPATLTVAAGGIIAGIAIMVVGIAASAGVSESYQRAVLPPPTVINSQLPTHESIMRGRDLFAQACSNWIDARDLRALIERLPRTRDEAIFFALKRDGWWSLPACASEHAETDVWHMVNYLKALENGAV